MKRLLLIICLFSAGCAGRNNLTNERIDLSGPSPSSFATIGDLETGNNVGVTNAQTLIGDGIQSTTGVPTTAFQIGQAKVVTPKDTIIESMVVTYNDNGSIKKMELTGLQALISTPLSAEATRLSVLTEWVKEFSETERERLRTWAEASSSPIAQMILKALAGI